MRLCRCHYACGHYNRALELLDEAQALLPDDRKRFEGAHFEWNKGSIYSVLQHGEIAEKYMLEALQLYRELGDLEGEIHALGSLAHLCDVSGRHEEAIAYMRREIEKRRVLGEDQNEALYKDEKARLHWWDFDLR